MLRFWSQILLFILFAPPGHAFSIQCIEAARGVDAQSFGPNWVQAKQSKNISQLFRSNARHRWAWTNQHGANFFGKLGLFKGWVLGDAHPGNLSFVKISDGWQFLSVDHDESHLGSFIGDFAGLVVSIRSVGPKIVKVAEMSEAYIDGLRALEKLRSEVDFAPKISDSEVQELIWNGFHRPPKFVSDHLGKLINKYDKAEDRYVEKKIKKKQGAKPTLKIVKGKVEKLPKNKRYLLESFGKQMPEWEVLDAAVRVKERGGSAENERYWLLVRPREGGRLRILEEKEYTEASLAQGADLNMSKRETLAWVLDRAWGESWKSDPAIDVHSVDDRVFLLRPKGILKLETPYSWKRGLHDLAIFDSYITGIYHALDDEQGAEWANQFSSLVVDGEKRESNDRLRLGVRGYSRAYLARLKRALKK